MTNSMALVLPTPSVTPGPAWATAINTALTTVAEHDHSSGDGVKITPAGMNIISDLAMNNNNLSGARTARLQAQGALVNGAADLGCIVNVNGDLWWVNGAGTGVQLTTGGAINIASVGTIGGDYGQPGVTASVAYSNTTKTFTFLQNSGQGAKIFSGTINIANEAASSLSVSIGASASSAAYTVILPIAAPAADTVLSFDGAGQATFRAISGTAGEVTVSASVSAHTVSLPATITKNLTFSGTHAVSGASTFSGATIISGSTVVSGNLFATGYKEFSGETVITGSNISGFGIVPRGAVLATMPHLVGAYSCSATTVADANGFVQCNGQTIADASSPMNGAVIPNINDNAFLRGNVTSGSAAGSNADITLAIANMPSHTHSMTHGHANTFGLTGTTSFAGDSHTHDMAHVHQTESLENISSQNRIYAFSSLASAFVSSFNSGTSGVSLTVSNNIPIALAATANVSTVTNPMGARYSAAAINSSGGMITNTGAPSSTASVGFSGAVTNHTGDVTSTGSGTSFSVLPKYISARYIIRIK